MYIFDIKLFGYFCVTMIWSNSLALKEPKGIPRIGSILEEYVGRQIGHCPPEHIRGGNGRLDLLPDDDSEL